MAHREDLLIIFGNEFPEELIIFYDNDLFPRRKTTFFHHEKLEIIYADDIINNLNTIYCDNSLNLNRKTTFFHHDGLVINRENLFDQIKRNI
jgi:hypothetical protein